MMFIEQPIPVFTGSYKVFMKKKKLRRKNTVAVACSIIRGLSPIGGKPSDYATSCQLQQLLISWYLLQEQLLMVKTVHCSVHCTLYTVHCTLYTLHCILYTVQQSSGQMGVHCTATSWVYTVYCTLYINQHGVHCLVYSVQQSSGWIPCTNPSVMGSGEYRGVKHRMLCKHCEQCIQFIQCIQCIHCLNCIHYLHCTRFIHCTNCIIVNTILYAM